MTSNYEAWAEGWKAAMEYNKNGWSEDIQNPYKPEPKWTNFTPHMLTPEEVKDILGRNDQG